MLSLAEAIKTHRIPEFIAQEQARGVGPIDRAGFDALLTGAAKSPPAKGQTSRSSSDDDLTETKTRQGSGPYASR